MFKESASPSLRLRLYVPMHENRSDRPHVLQADGFGVFRSLDQVCRLPHWKVGFYGSEVAGVAQPQSNVCAAHCLKEVMLSRTDGW